MIKSIARWTAIIALFTIPFLPLYVANSLFFPFITGKAFAFRILVEIAFCAWVGLAALDAKYRPRFSWTLVIFGVFTLWTALADALAINPLKAFWSNFERMDGWVTVIHLFAFFLVTGSVLAVDKLWRKWWFTFISVTAVVCVYGLIQLSGHAAIHQGGVRVDASLGNAIYLAVYLLFSLAITIWLAIESKGWLRYSLIVLALAEGVVLFGTATRGAILALVGATGFAALLLLIQAGKKGRGIAGGLLVGIVLLIGGLFLVKDSAWIKADPTLARISSISLSEGTTRFTLWNMALKGTAERPLTGWGQEGFNYVFNKYYQPSLYAQEPWFDRAHNVFIDWLVAGGIPAFLLYIGLLISAGVALLRSKMSPTERILLVSAVVAYTIQGMFVFDNLFASIPLTIILAMAHVASSKDWKQMDKLPVAKSETSQAIILSSAAVAIIALIWMVNVPAIQTAHSLVYAISDIPGGSAAKNEYFKKAIAENSFGTQEVREQLITYAASLRSSTTATDAEKTVALRLALTEMGKQVASVPQDARLRLQYATGFEAAGDNANALVQIQEALKLSPVKQGTLLKEGIDEWQSGNKEAASEALRKAYDLDPSFTDLAPYAAAGYVITGDYAAAAALLQTALGTTTVDNELLYISYYQAKHYDEFLAIARLRVAASGGSPDTRFKLAQAYAGMGKYAEARKEIADTVKAHPETASYAAKLSSTIFAGAK